MTRDAIDIRDGDFLDSRQVRFGRLEAVQRQRVGPDRGQPRDGVFLEFGLPPFLHLGRGDQLGRHTVTGDARENGSHLLLQGLVVGARRERYRREREPGAGQRVHREFRGDGFALRDQTVEVKAAAGQHIRQQFQGRGVGTVQSRHAERDHLRAFRTVGVDGERGVAARVAD